MVKWSKSTANGLLTKQYILSSASSILSSSPILYSSAANHVSEKPTGLVITTSGIVTGCSNFPSQSKNPRKQCYNSTISKMRSSHHPSEHPFQKNCSFSGYRIQHQQLFVKRY
ncbi:hypothetical protein TNCT_422401 [Trichonephila clavata]|uniref:Uncharacterized protein n=1 Tax=Trichonephila clavata TaxID=2740835 RepID=A0A8X6FDK9_TRICU|nr:hypothetical protein TNCT_422401 [Trichonephila clavata]